MELSRLQQILARLYTDRTFCKRFFNDPIAACAELRLSRIELDLLADLSGAQVEFFASSLVRKRMNEVRKMLPLLSRVLGRTFERLFRCYAETHRLEALKPHELDAVAFSRFFVREARSMNFDPLWSVDVARYETAKVEVLALGRWWAVQWFRYPLRELLQSLITRDGAPPAPRPSLAIWFRLSHEGKLRHFSFDLSTSCFPLLRLTGRATGIRQENSGARS